MIILGYFLIILGVLLVSLSLIGLVFVASLGFMTELKHFLGILKQKSRKSKAEIIDPISIEEIFDKQEEKKDD
jgi:hypothetical protein